MIDLEKLKEEIEILRHPYGFLVAGYPRFNRLFGRDSIISAWQLLDYDITIAKNTLKILSELQGKKVENLSEEEPGKILHETDLVSTKHPSFNWPFPYYGSVDATPLYLILFGFYFEKTKDKNFIEKYWQNIEKAISWIFDYGDKDKNLFIEYEKNNPESLENHCWKDSNEYKIKHPVEIVEVQGYEYLALKEVAKLAKILNKDESFIEKLEERANLLKEKFNQEFWMEDKKFFALALDGDKKQVRKITSNPGHLLFTGIVDEDKIDDVVKRLFENDMWTPYGIRTYSSLEKDFDPLSYHLGSIWPHDNWIIAQGMKELGYLQEYKKIKEAIIRAYHDLGFLPEYYAVIDNKIIINGLKRKNPDYPQAWSTGALINFLISD